MKLFGTYAHWSFPVRAERILFKGVTNFFGNFFPLLPVKKGVPFLKFSILLHFYALIFFILKIFWCFFKNSFFRPKKLQFSKKKISVLLKFKGVTGLRYSLVPPSLFKIRRTSLKVLVVPYFRLKAPLSSIISLSYDLGT